LQSLLVFDLLFVVLDGLVTSFKGEKESIKVPYDVAGDVICFFLVFHGVPFAVLACGIELWPVAHAIGLKDAVGVLDGMLSGYHPACAAVEFRDV
jgi:hypothetical protein